MDEIVKLLNEKNICLKRFSELNDQELDFIQSGHFDNLDQFYTAREGLLGIIKHVDEMIEMASLSYADKDANMAISPQSQDSVKRCLEVKDHLVKKIISQDLEILSAIDVAKNSIIRELADVKTVRKAIGSYKSSSERHKLDEEA
jgi:hypothetical protein